MVKFVRRDLIGGTDVPLEATSRCRTIVKIIADMIISTNTGWGYDSRTQGDTYLYIPSQDGNFQYAVKYLENSTSHAKLMITAFAMSDSNSYPQKNQYPKIANKNYFNPLNVGLSANFENSNYFPYPYGVSMAMIPAGSSSTFPSELTFDYTTRFIPNDAIPLVTETYFFASVGSKKGIDLNAFGGIVNNSILSYGLLVDSEFIFIFSGMSNTETRSQLYPKYALGKIFGTLAHSSDSTYTARYGALRFDNYNGNTITMSKTLNNISHGFFGYDFQRTIHVDLTDRPQAFFFAADSTPILYNGCYDPLGVEIVTNAISNDIASGATRWCPIAVAVMYYPDLVGYYVVQGDGFKGYLDTSLFRCATCNRDNYYNNGDFVGLPSNWLVAWDKTATDNLA